MKIWCVVEKNLLEFLIMKRPPIYQLLINMNSVTQKNQQWSTYDMSVNQRMKVQGSTMKNSSKADIFKAHECIKLPDYFPFIEIYIFKAQFG